MKDYSDSTIDEAEGCPQLLDLIPTHRDWVARKAEDTHRTFSVERELDLSLGPPGGAWTITDKNISREMHLESLVSFGYFSVNPCARNPVLEPPWQHQGNFLHIQSTSQQVPVMESSHHCVNRAAATVRIEKKPFSAAPAIPALPSSTSAHKRTAPSPVVGWPPIRSFRKNFTSGTSKLDSDPLDIAPGEESAPLPVENCPKTLFVKINMDGIPIGRKVDLKAYDSYQKLSYAVDELFKHLLAAQSDSSVDRNTDRESRGKPIEGILNGCGEYTLVYEDNEGDRMLVGDVPWNMFVSTVKRLRVLKSSELSNLSSERKQRGLSLEKPPSSKA